VKEDDKRRELAKQTLVNEWNVRELEEAVQNTEVKGKPKTKSKAKKRDPYIEEIEETLREKFQTTVKIKPNKDKGRIELSYFGRGDLERLLELLKALA
jgi:ParB family chromosome partitioning protein